MHNCPSVAPPRREGAGAGPAAPASSVRRGRPAPAVVPVPEVPAGRGAAPVSPAPRPAPVPVPLARPPHVHPRGRGVRSLRDGEVNAYLLAIQISPVQSLPRLGCVRDVLEIDETEASAATAVAVLHHLHLLQPPVLAECFLELPLSCVQTEPENADTLAGLRGVPVPKVTPPVRHRGLGVLLPPPRSLLSTFARTPSVSGTHPFSGSGPLPGSGPLA